MVQIYCYYYYYYYDYFSSPLAQSRIELREMCNGCNSVSRGNHGVPEGDCIPSLKSCRKALEHYHYHCYYKKMKS